MNRPRATALGIVLLGCVLAGCGGPSEPAAPRGSANTDSGEGSPAAEHSGTISRPPASASEPAPLPAESPDRTPASAPSGEPGRPASDARGPRPGQPADAAPPPPLLSELLSKVPDAAARRIDGLPRVKVDEAKAAAAGIRKLESRRLVLYTDLPPAPEIDQLPELVDQAFPQYCEYFRIDPERLDDWRLTGFLMKEKGRFVATGLLPRSLPPFPHGYARNDEIWLYDQPSDYYRRHLLLHEGVHAFMNTVLGACGPPWYMEGVAELLATHHWQDGTLRLAAMPADKQEVEYWGRIKLVREAFAARRARRMRQVAEFLPGAFLENESYAWAWAAAAFLDGHPRYRDRFRSLSDHVLRPDFNREFYRLFADDWQELCEEWQVFVGELEYGYDLEAAATDFTPGEPLSDGGTSVAVRADRGWQNSGLRLEGGTAYRLIASGRYQVAQEPQIWWCEPGGVSIRYYRGRPLGILLCALRGDDADEDVISGLLFPVEVGLGTTITPPKGGTLYFKINDSPAELDDNAGQLRVEIQPAQAGNPSPAE
jgi:hypothetical protein